MTERMLRQSDALAPLGGIAVAHRERLDGSGYRRGPEGADTSASPEQVLALASTDVSAHRAKVWQNGPRRSLRCTSAARPMRSPSAISSCRASIGPRLRHGGVFPHRTAHPGLKVGGADTSASSTPPISTCGNATSRAARCRTRTGECRQDLAAEMLASPSTLLPRASDPAMAEPRVSRLTAVVLGVNFGRTLVPARRDDLSEGGQKH